MQGRVAVSHAFALGTIEPHLFEEVADGLARAEVAIMTSCPPSAPVPPLRALRERGVTVFAGSDNIRDCWSPFGNRDMLDRAALIAARHVAAPTWAAGGALGSFMTCLSVSSASAVISQPFQSRASACREITE